MSRKKIAFCITYPWIVLVYRLVFILNSLYLLQFERVMRENKKVFIGQTKHNGKKQFRPGTNAKTEGKWTKINVFMFFSFYASAFYALPLFLCLGKIKKNKKGSLWGDGGRRKRKPNCAPTLKWHEKILTRKWCRY